jgi:hypothetical protein
MKKLDNIAKKGKKPPQVEGAIVSEDLDPGWKRLFGGRLSFVIPLILLLVLFGLVGWFSYQQLKKRTTAANEPVCSVNEGAVLRDEAAANLKSSKVKELGSVVERIKQVKGFESDPNCLYPIIRYYLYLSDAKNAQQFYDKLAAVYDEKTGLAPEYNTTDTLKTLKKRIAAAKQFNQSVDKNVRYVNVGHEENE